MTAWLLRGIWRLYPSRWRRRFADELRMDLERLEAREFGGWGAGAGLVLDALVTLVRAWLHEAKRLRPLEEVRRDVTLALRGAIRSPLHAATVILTLALAIGANAAIVSVTRSVLTGNLPYAEPERVVEVEPAPLAVVTSDGFGDWRVSRSFTSLPDVEGAALYVPDASGNLAGAEGASRVRVTFVGPGFFRVMGVEPLLGTDLPEEEPAGTGLLSHALWVRAFGADPGVVGRSVRLSGHRVRIAGVLPATAEFPGETELYLPLPAIPELFGGASAPDAVARLRAGVDRSVVAEAWLARLAEEAAARGSDPPGEVHMTPLRERLAGPVRTPLLVLTGAALAIFLLGCLNLAGLQVARAMARARELGVRRALGAGRGRLFRQLLVEVGALAAVGGGVALAVAWGVREALARWLPAGVPGVEGGLSPSGGLLTAAAAVLATLAVGVPAAVGAVGAADPGPPRSRGATAGRERFRLQGALVVAQVAVAVVLALGAGLFGRSLAELRAVPLGYDTERVLTFEVQLPGDTYPDDGARSLYRSRVEETLVGLPGVTAVGATTRLPLSAGLGIGLNVRPPDVPEEDGTSASWIRVSPGFFAAMGIPLTEGRPDMASDGWVPSRVVVDRTLARRHVPEGAVAGRTLRIRWFDGNPVDAVVAGLAEPVRLSGPDSEARPVLYSALGDAAPPRLGFAVRAGGAPLALTNAVRAALADIDPSVPPHELRTTAQAVAGQLAARRAVAIVSACFGAAAMLLLGLGLYGLVAGAVAARRREHGIRLALGARAGSLVGGTVIRAVALVGLGLAIGVPAGLAVTGRVTGLLHGVTPGDPGVLGAGVGLVLTVGVVAAWIPAARVGRVDPVESLRED